MRNLIGKSFQSDPSKDKFAELALTLNHFRAEVEIISIRKYSAPLRNEFIIPDGNQIIKLTMKNGQTYFEILSSSHWKILKVYLAIFQHYA